MEGSDPVEYRGIQTNDIVMSPFLPSREWFFLHKTLTWQEALVELWIGLGNDATTNPSGSITRVSCSQASLFKAGDAVSIRGTDMLDGEHDVVEADDSTIDIETGAYFQQTIPSTGEIRHTSTGYGKTEWMLDEVSTTQWGVQARDNARPVNNKTEISALKTIREPEAYPWDVYNKWFETQHQPEGTI